MANKGSSSTIYDVAEHAGVSPKTVSRVINNHPRVAAELRERVKRAIAAISYTPNHAARTLKGPFGYTLALLTAPHIAAGGAEEEPYRGPYFGAIEANALRAAQEFGYRFIVTGVRTDGSDLEADLDRLRQARVDGVILTPPECDSAALLAALETRSIPYFRITPGIDPARGGAAGIDERAAAAAATEHLLALGHRRIAMIAGPAEHVAAARRVEGFRDAMSACPGTWDPPVVTGDFMPWTGHRRATELMQRAEPPTAIFTANDGMAAGVIAAAVDLDLRVPRDLSVVGFDDSEIALFTWPPLTTIHQPVGRMAREAVQRLVGALDGSGEPAPMIVLPHRLVERRSTAAPRE